MSDNGDRQVSENVKADEVKTAAIKTAEEETAAKDADLVDISEEIKSDAKKDDPGDQRMFTVRKKKKWVKWLIIILIIIAVVAFVIIKSIQTANKLKEALAGSTQEEQIKRMDISSTIATTGTIQSKDVRTLTSPLSGVKIDEVNYKVGDMVSQGDVVVTFSREDINKKINQLDEDIDEAKQTKALDSGNRENVHNSSYGTESYNLNNTYISVDRAAQDMQKAEDDLQTEVKKKSDFLQKYDEAKNNIDSKKEELEALTVQYNLWKAEGHPFHKDEKTPEDVIYNAQELDADYNFSNRISELNSKVTEYETTIKGYDNSILSYNASITSAQTKVDNAMRTYDDAVSKSNKAGYDAYYNTAKYDYDYNKGNVTANDNVKNLERQKEERIDSLDNYIVTAPISGLVTTVNAQEGNGYQATTGALMTIQAVDVLEVTTQVDEYDINNVTLGQRVVIMTDATGEDELEGRVTFIAPTATAQNGNSAATDTTFEVKIDVINKDNRLRLGMSAKLNFIVDIHKDVLAVPYDAIEEKEGGAHYIYVVDKSAAAQTDSKSNGIDVIGLDGILNKSEDKPETATGEDGKDKSDDAFANRPANSRQIPVQIGLEGDYYTEVISPDIKEGMTVLVNSEAGELMSDFEMMMNDGP
ncbi:MAG: efflux RND transporter periplasmic adaptor subunit [Lachnospiraceae bacterium]|nr:efflux RND transporter periplasmic adaptor subunit [Lachnospiraceae bacterium]